MTSSIKPEVDNVSHRRQTDRGGLSHSRMQTGLKRTGN